MASSYTSLLGLVLPVTGELSGTWGQTINDSLTSLLDTAIAGTTTLSTDADVTLTTTTGTANQARQAIVLWTANGTATRNITAPAQSKIYTVINASAGTQSIVFRGAGPTAGVTIVKGESAVVAWNGSDFIKISNTGGAASFTNVTVSGTTTLSGLTASTALALNASKEVVSVTNTGTGNNVLSASPTLTGTVAGASLQLSSLTSGRVTYAGASGLLTDSANMTFNGTRLTVADLADSGLTATRVVYSTTGGALTDSANLTFDGTSLTLGGNPTLSAGTANGVAYLNGSKVLITGSALTFDGTNLGVNSSSTIDGGRFSVAFAGNTQNGIGLKDTADASGASFWGAYNSTGGFIGSLRRSGTDNALAINGNSYLAFQQNSTEQMRLTSTGLGIGTSSPLEKLQVNGAILTTGSLSAVRTSAASLDFLSGNTRFISMGADASTKAGFIWYNSTNAAVTEAMRLDSSGNLGLGVTPSANLAGSTLEINRAGNGISNFSGTDTRFTQNVYDSGGKFSRTGEYATQYQLNNGAHKWYTSTVTGTAGNAITFTQAMTLDASGRLGIGTTSPASALHVSGDTSLAGLLYLGAGTVFQEQRLSVIGTTSGSTGLAFSQWTGSSYTERARIDSSGNLLVGTQTAGAGVSIIPSFSETNASGIDIKHISGSSSGDYYVTFQYNNSLIGSITQSGTTGVAYNTSSDYRLKENIQPMTGALAKVAQLKPCTYNWKVDGSAGEGFIAHELQEVVPQCVTGEKDAVDAEGKPVYQGIDTSFLVATLTAALQEAVAEINQLKARLDAANL